MTAPHLLVHDPKDTVGVVVVEGLEAGTYMTCVITAANDTRTRGPRCSSSPSRRS